MSDGLDCVGWIDLCGSEVAAGSGPGEGVRIAGGDGVEALCRGSGPPPTVEECLVRLPLLPRVEHRTLAARAFGEWLAQRSGSGYGLLLVPPRYPAWLRYGLRDGALRVGARIAVCDGAACLLLGAAAAMLGIGAQEQQLRSVGGWVPLRISRLPGDGETWVVEAGDLRTTRAGGQTGLSEEEAGALRRSGAAVLSGAEGGAAGRTLLLRRTSLLVVRALGGTSMELPFPSSTVGGASLTATLPELTGPVSVGHRFADVPPTETAEHAAWVGIAGCAVDLALEPDLGLLTVRCDASGPGTTSGWPLRIADLVPPLVV
ncbi:MAG: hypothetical protein JWM27_2427 [Gemmatimonadetes bacterium]|nr:hypothetical protein [Gemmatimonadota bacterium]